MLHLSSAILATAAMARACSSLASRNPNFRLPASCSTLRSALQIAERAFTAQGVPEADLSAQYLLARAAGFSSSRAELALRLDRPLPAEARAQFETMCEQRLQRTPVQYILGDWDFHELVLTLRPPVLIPRPETEQLVELVLQAHAAHQVQLPTGGAARSETPATASSADVDPAAARGLRILDVGCGSGAIGLALLHQMPAAECVGLDVRPEAADLAAFNAEALGLDDRYHSIMVAG